MPSFTATHSSPHSADSLFDLVADVASYPEFLPACQKAEILEASETHVLARLTIGYGILHESFTSAVHLDKKAGIIHAVLRGGSLKNLNCHWRFIPQDEGCYTHCALEFEYRSFLLARLTAPLLDRAAARLVESFIQRAHSLVVKQR